MAGAGWRDFVPGEVLTAANVQDYLQDQVVMTFASAAARTSAIASPTEGMTTYLKDTNLVQVYDGAAWFTIADDGGLPVANGGTGATTVLAAQDNLLVGATRMTPTSVGVDYGSASVTNGEITYSTVGRILVNGVFTGDFRNYTIKWVNRTSLYNRTLAFRLSSGGTIQTANYYSQGMKVDANAAPANYGYVFGGGEMQIGDTNVGFDSGMLIGTINVYNPFTYGVGTNFDALTGGGNRLYIVRGGHDVNSKDGFAIASNGGDQITGTITVYGWN